MYAFFKEQSDDDSKNGPPILTMETAMQKSPEFRSGGKKQVATNNASPLTLTPFHKESVLPKVANSTTSPQTLTLFHKESVSPKVADKKSPKIPNRGKNQLVTYSSSPESVSVMPSDKELALSLEMANKKSELKQNKNSEEFGKTVIPSHTQKPQTNAKQKLFQNKSDQSTKTHSNSLMGIESTKKMKCQDKLLIRSSTGAGHGKSKTSVETKPKSDKNLQPIVIDRTSDDDDNDDLSKYPEAEDDEMSIPHIAPSPISFVGHSTHSLSPKTSSYQNRTSAEEKKNTGIPNNCNKESDSRSCSPGSKRHLVGGSGNRPSPLVVKLRKKNEDTGCQVSFCYCIFTNWKCINQLLHN